MDGAKSITDTPEIFVEIVFFGVIIIITLQRFKNEDFLEKIW